MGTFRRAHETPGQIYGIEIDDRDLLEHLSRAIHESAYSDCQELRVFLFSYFRGNITAFVGERDAYEIVGQSLTDNIRERQIHCLSTDDRVFLSKHKITVILVVVFAEKLFIP